MAEPAFEQTNDLVRFRVRGANHIVLESIQAAKGELVRAYMTDPGSCDCTFICSKDAAPRALAILERHGVERVGRMP